MDDARREQLYDSWKNETEEPWTQEWRDDLTPEELDYVDQLDNNFDKCILRICTVGLVLEQIRQRYSPAEIQELQAVGDHYRLWLRDGSAYLARLATDGSLRLDPIDPAC